MNTEMVTLKQELVQAKEDLKVVMDKLDKVIDNRSQYVTLRESLVKKETDLKDAKDFMEIYSLLIKEGWSCLALGLLSSLVKVIGIIVPILTWSFIPVVFTVVGVSSVTLFPLIYHKEKEEAKQTLKNYKGQQDEYSVQDLDSKIEELDARYTILDSQKEKLIQKQRDIRETIRLKNIVALTDDNLLKENDVEKQKVKIKK